MLCKAMKEAIIKREQRAISIRMKDGINISKLRGGCMFDQMCIRLFAK